MKRTRLLLLTFLLTGCGQISNSSAEFLKKETVFKTIADIPVPEGYQRVNADKGSFAEWLRTIALKKDRHVYLYNGTLKKNQEAQFAVLDISVGKTDLQQCADAVMR